MSLLNATWACTNYHWPILKDKKLWPVQALQIIWPWGQRSRSNVMSWYVTHHLMVMHPHTKYHWPILKGKKLWPIQASPSIWPWGQRSRSKMSWWYATHRLMVMHPHTKYHWLILKGKKVMARTSFTNYFTFIWPWGQRSRSNECHDGTRHTV